MKNQLISTSVIGRLPFLCHKTTFSLLLFVSIAIFSCSKKDSSAPPPNTPTSVTISNQSGLDFSGLALVAYTVTDTAQLANDTARHAFNYGALTSGASTAVLQMDKKYKSLFIVFYFTNPMLGNNTYRAIVRKLGDGTSTYPYLLQAGQKTTITLDSKMSYGLL